MTFEFCAAWTGLHERHFQQSKDALAAATCLAHPLPTAETRINTGASDTAVGAVLQLRFAFSSASDKWYPRQQRHLALVSEFTTYVRHVRGADNVVADALSRVSLEDHEPDVIAAMEGVMTSVINYAAMAAQQGADAGIQRVVSDPNC